MGVEELSMKKIEEKICTGSYSTFAGGRGAVAARSRLRSMQTSSPPSRCFSEMERPPGRASRRKEVGKRGSSSLRTLLFP